MRITMSKRMTYAGNYVSILNKQLLIILITTGLTNWQIIIIIYLTNGQLIMMTLLTLRKRLEMRPPLLFN